ncbi:hypothetical protein AT05_07795 [Schleiferia thermophila str. Yellowstone]|nr:hypothetical protein AT05_07795 [Schleiferia thermophila str. Yellowstone]
MEGGVVVYWEVRGLKMEAFERVMFMGKLVWMVVFGEWGCKVHTV